MKKITLVALLLSFTLSSFAQLKPEGGDWGFGFQITGLSNVALFNQQSTNFSGQRVNDPYGIISGPTIDPYLPQAMILVKRYTSETMAWRLGLNAAYYSSTSTESDSVGAAFMEMTESLSTFSAGIAVGIERHLASAAVRIDPYIGAQISGAYLHNINYESNTTFTGATNSETQDIINYPGGWTAGLDLLGGFNYFFTSNFSLGAEFSLGFHHRNYGGAYTRLTQDVVNDNVLFDESRTIKTVDNMLRVNSTGGVNATIFF